MVNRQIVLDTIKRMNESGIDQSVIRNTLKDIGLNDAEIREYLAAAGTTARAAPASEAPEARSEHEELAKKTAEKVREHLAEDREERELQDSILSNQLEEQGEQLSGMHEKVSLVHAKIDSLSGSLSNPETLRQLTELNKRITDFEGQLSDLKALGNATKTILEKILETNREILGKL